MFIEYAREFVQYLQKSRDPFNHETQASLLVDKRVQIDLPMQLANRIHVAINRRPVQFTYRMQVRAAEISCMQNEYYQEFSERLLCMLFERASCRS